MDYVSEQIKNLPEWTEIRVTWLDAHAPHSGWHDVDDYTPDDATAITIGRLWKNCKIGYLTMVGTIFQPEDGIVKTVGDVNHIPLPWIVKLEIIGDGTAIH